MTHRREAGPGWANNGCRLAAPRRANSSSTGPTLLAQPAIEHNVADGLVDVTAQRTAAFEIIEASLAVPSWRCAPAECGLQRPSSPRYRPGCVELTSSGGRFDNASPPCPGGATLPRSVVTFGGAVEADWRGRRVGGARARAAPVCVAERGSNLAHATRRAPAGQIAVVPTTSLARSGVDRQRGRATAPQPVEAIVQVLLEPRRCFQFGHAE
jgi:hypothetical protein